MRGILFFVGRWATNISLACLAIASSVKPEDAMSNISGWAAKFGLPDPPWLQSHAADQVVFWVALAGIVISWGVTRYGVRWINYLRGTKVASGTKEGRPGLFIECASVLPSQKIPAHTGTTWLCLTDPAIDFAMNLRTETSNTDGVLAAANETGGPTIFEFKVINYEDAPAINADLTFVLRHQNSLPGMDGVEYQGGEDIRERSKAIRIPKIDPGPQKPFVFYIRNLTPEFVQLALEKTATIHRLGNGVPQIVPVTSDLVSRSIIFEPHI
jgi:hypothetical protein